MGCICCSYSNIGFLTIVGIIIFIFILKKSKLQKTIKCYTVRSSKTQSMFACVGCVHILLFSSLYLNSVKYRSITKHVCVTLLKQLNSYFSLTHL